MVLVVEDEPDLRELISTVLQNRGYDVRIARNGNEALHIYQEHEGKIGLVLTDMIMPGMSGPALVESLQRLNPALRVLYMSGYAGDVVASERGLDSGIPYIQKPFTSVNLLSKVRGILDGSTPRHLTVSAIV
jgi:two-component system, cell cycle sensor histidine kinase and response regulator CckA